MKNLLYTLLILPFFTLGQNIADFNFVAPLNTGANMTYVINTPPLLEQFQGGQIGAFLDLDGDQIFECIGVQTILSGSFGLALWGDDSSTPEKDGLESGEVPIFAINYEGQVTLISPIPEFSGYVTNGISVMPDFTIGSFGCMSDIADNYNPSAIIDDGSCQYPIYGCTDFLYTEYYPAATIDNGSCTTLIVEGCTDPVAFNYEPAANTDNGSCEPVVNGCLDPDTQNYNPEANVDPAAAFGTTSCIPHVYGCMSDWAENYNDAATADDGSCFYGEPGCTNPLDINYDNQAVIDDGSCDLSISDMFVEPLNTGDNMSSCVNTDLDEEYVGGQLGYFYDLNGDGTLQCVGLGTITPGLYCPALWGDDSSTPEKDGLSWGDIPIVAINYEGQVTIINPIPEFPGYVTNGLYLITSFTTDIYGCMSDWADNYDESATIDDGSCYRYGCTSDWADNYDELATIDDGSCYREGCTQDWADNYDPLATIDDSSCYRYGCINSNYIEYYNQGNTVANVDDGSCFKEVQNLDLVADNFQIPMNTGSNMTVGIDLQSSLYIPEGTILGAFYDLNQDGIINTDTYIAENGASYSECIGLEEYTEGFFAISLWGDDSSTSTQDGLQSGETDVLFALLTPDNQVIAINVVPEFTGYASNSISLVTEFDLDVTIYGCMDQSYCNYNPQAEEDDGSCEGIPGCMEPIYVQYSETAGCSNSDLCLTTWEETYYFALDSAAVAFADDEAADDALLVQTIYDYEDLLAYTLDSAALAFALDEEADAATISALEDELAYWSSPIPIDLLLGWNIIGYTYREPQDAVATLQEITEIIEIVKNNAAEVYWPEYGFNGIGDLIPGQGYQIKVTEEYPGFTYLDTEGQRIELTPTVPQWALDMEVEMHPNDIRTLVRVVNLLGQEVNPEIEPKGSVLLYLYNDATVEKKLVE